MRAPNTIPLQLGTGEDALCFLKHPDFCGLALALTWRDSLVPRQPRGKLLRGLTML